MTDPPKGKSKQALAPNAIRVWISDRNSGHYPTPIQDSQMVLPRFIRYPNSPVLTPIINKMVKMMMSHRTFLGIHSPPLNPDNLGQAREGNFPLILIIIISMGKVTGKKIYPVKTIS
jgi:hypothetical protein